MRRQRLFLAPIAVFVVLAACFPLVSCNRIRDLRERIRERNAIQELDALEPIDAHTHITNTGPQFLTMLERLHMHVLDILYVDDTTSYRSSLDRQRQDALAFIASSHGRATLCSTFDPFHLNDASFAEQAIKSLNQDFASGAVAAKVWKNIGMEIKDASGRYIMPDNPVFTPIYRDIADQKKTLVIHAADSDGAWQRETPDSPKPVYFKNNPQWDMSRKPDAPSKQQILAARDRLLEQNPDLRVVGAHLGSLEAQLDEIGALLDRYPNFAVDISGRVRHLTRLPRENVRKFFLEHQDRILYGTDLSFSQTDADATAQQTWQRQYLLDWRYFSTGDAFTYLGRPVQGIKLPSAVLKKLYHDNAVRWIPGIANAP